MWTHIDLRWRFRLQLVAADDGGAARGWRDSSRFYHTYEKSSEMTNLADTNWLRSFRSMRLGFLWRHGLAAGLLLIALIWSYWPTLVGLVEAWEAEPDYSHGYFVVPIAIWFLWIRRDRFPHGAVHPAVAGGLAILAGTLVVRYLGGRFFLVPVDGWSLMLWIAGVVAALAGWRVLWWSLPSIVFLLFMIPMPFTAEHLFRQPLQYLATQISCATLVILGQPAIAEANTIRIGEAQFGIAEACSGLRIFVGIVALAFAYVVVVRRSWLIKGVLLLSVIPITLLANSARIVVTCLLSLHGSGEAARRFSHDIAGFVMIPLAALLFGLVLWYLGHLFREVRVASVGDVIRHSAANELMDQASAS